MSNNKLKNANDAMFSMLGRLDKYALGTTTSDVVLGNLVTQAKAMSGVCKQIVDINKLELEAAQLKRRRLIHTKPSAFEGSVTPMTEDESDD